MISSQKRYEIFSRDFFTCQRCGKTGIGLTVAHKIKSGSGTENFIRKYVKSKYQIELSNKMIDCIIDHPFNLTTACRGNCNDAQNIFHNPSERDNLLERILKEERIV